MAIVTSLPQGKDAKVVLYDIPDADLAKYQVAGDKAASMFPEAKGVSGASAKEVSPAPEMTGDMQGYSGLCVCSGILCNGYGQCCR